MFVTKAIILVTLMWCCCKMLIGRETEFWWQGRQYSHQHPNCHHYLLSPTWVINIDVDLYLDGEYVPTSNSLTKMPMTKNVDKMCPSSVFNCWRFIHNVVAIFLIMSPTPKPVPIRYQYQRIQPKNQEWSIQLECSKICSRTFGTQVQLTIWPTHCNCLSVMFSTCFWVI